MFLSCPCCHSLRRDHCWPAKEEAAVQDFVYFWGKAPWGAAWRCPFQHYPALCLSATALTISLIPNAAVPPLLIFTLNDIPSLFCSGWPIPKKNHHLETSFFYHLSHQSVNLWFSLFTLSSSDAVTPIWTAYATVSSQFSPNFKEFAIFAPQLDFTTATRQLLPAVDWVCFLAAAAASSCDYRCILN